MRASLAVLLVVFVASHSAGQDKPLNRIAFDVASVRVNTTGSDGSTFRSTGSGGIVFTNASLRDIIVRAYEIPFNLRQYLLVGGPSSVLVQRFDVQAVPPAGASSEHVPLMLQTLLTDRFDFRAHREKRSILAYAVRLAREGQLGPALRAADFSCQDYFGTGKSPKLGSDKTPWCTPSPVAGAMHLRGASTISSMLRSLQGFTGRRRVR